MGFADWFSFKSKEEKEREARAYEAWAFPYGPQQKDRLSDIIKLLLPEEPVKAAMVVFLMGREGYRGSMKESAEEVAAKSEEKRLIRTTVRIADMLPGRKKKLLSRYVALIIADSTVDGNLNYPTVEQLRQKAQELEPVLKNL